MENLEELNQRIKDINDLTDIQTVGKIKMRINSLNPEDRYVRNVIIPNAIVKKLI